MVTIYYILYRIDTSKIPDNVRFYGDPNYKYGYFTEGTIPTQALSVIESIDYTADVDFSN